MYKLLNKIGIWLARVLRKQRKICYHCNHVKAVGSPDFPGDTGRERGCTCHFECGLDNHLVIDFLKDTCEKWEEK